MASRDARSAAILVRRLFAACALGCFSLAPAFAALPVTKVGPSWFRPAPNKVQVKYDGPAPAANQNSFQRSFSTDVVPGGVAVNDAVKVALAGAVLDVVVSRAVSPSALPLIAVAAAAGGGLVIGGAINEWFDSAGIRVAPSGGFEYIPPQDMSAPGSGAWGWSGIQPASGYSTAEIACKAWSAMFGVNTSWIEALSATQFACKNNYHGNLGVVSKTTHCPIGQPDPSGLCPYNGAWAPAPPGLVPDLLSANPPPNPAGVVDEAIDHGVDVPATSPELSGPASTPGPSTTYTGPDGVTDVTVTNNYSYDGDTITVTQITNTTNPDGSIETETTEDVPDAAECEKNPSLLSCAELDQPEPTEIPQHTENVSFQAENVFGGGQCPANVQASFATIGKSATIVDWQTFCGHALPLRALVIGLASIMAMFIIMPGGKVE